MTLLREFIFFLASAKNLKSLYHSAEDSSHGTGSTRLIFTALAGAWREKGLDRLEVLELRIMIIRVSELLPFLKARRTPLKRLSMTYMLEDTTEDQPTHVEEQIQEALGAEHLEELIVEQSFAEHPAFQM